MDSLCLKPTLLVTTSLKDVRSMKSTFVITSLGVGLARELPAYRPSVISISVNSAPICFCHLFSVLRFDEKDPVIVMLLPLYIGSTDCEADICTLDGGA